MTNPSLIRIARSVAQSSSAPATVDTSSVKSFINDELRPFAMRLHTRDQAPKEGQQKAQTPFTQWTVTRANYLQFLADSLAVYEALERSVAAHPAYSSLRDTGLERTEALRQDIQWLLVFDPSLSAPATGPAGKDYAALLEALAGSSEPKFVCHFYNHYFAHTAGGRMIGKRLADQLLGGHTLQFYKWPRGDVKELLEAVRTRLDALAACWTPEQRTACLEETVATFQRGGSLMASLMPPAAGRH